jgi:hypothetical protein
VAGQVRGLALWTVRQCDACHISRWRRSRESNSPALAVAQVALDLDELLDFIPLFERNIWTRTCNTVMAR